MGASDAGCARDASEDAQDTQDAIVGMGAEDAAVGGALASDALPRRLAAQAQQQRLRARPPRPKHNASGRAQTTLPAWTHAATASPAQQVGMQVEEQVCQYLQTQGARILVRNVRSRHGEIDIVCVDAGVLAFVEVRHRSNSRYGGAAASVGHRKQARLIRTAQAWLPRLVRCYFDGRTPLCRFDVVAVRQGRIDWIKQAFRMVE